MSDFIEIELPDGKKARFPKGMSRAEMAAALNSFPGSRKTQNTNPGVSADAPPNMFLNPQTGQYTSRELLTNHMMQNQTAPTTAMGATVMGAGRGATLGGIDEISGYLNATVPGEGTMAERNTFGREYARAAEDAGRQSNPDDMLTSEIAGAVSLPIGALWQGGKLAPKILGSALSGAGLAATYGGLTGEGQENRVEQARGAIPLGAAAGVGSTLLGAGVQKVANSRAEARALKGAMKNANTAARQRSASGAQYAAFEDAGAEISPLALSRLRTSLESRLSQEGLGTLPGAGGLTPKTQTMLNIVRQMEDDVATAAQAGGKPLVPLKSIEQLRRVALEVGGDINAVGRSTADGRLGNIAVSEIDAFVDGLQQADVPIGDPAVATEALNKARALWAQSSKTQLLENILDQQDNYLGGAASAIRNRVASLLRNPRTAKQFSDVEKKVLRKIIGGNALSRAIRLAGNGIGRQMQMAGGAATGGIPGALAGALTGELSSEVANRAAVRSTEAARNLVANGGIRQLPQANPEIERIIEALARRAGATVPQ